MKTRRQLRVNSLLKEVIAEVIAREVANPHITGIPTVIDVETSKDLRYAKVYVSIMAATPEEIEKSFKALSSATQFIQIHASKKVELRYFPNLTIKLDDSVKRASRIEELLKDDDHPTRQDGGDG